MTCVHKGARCWPCMSGGCYETPTAHVWWDAEDVEDAAQRGIPAPTGQCGCAFCGWPAMDGAT